MRACPVCGTPNGETDDFCGNCGSYLGWSGTVAEPADGQNAGPVRPGAVPPPTADPLPATESAVDVDAQPRARQPARPDAPRLAATQRQTEAVVDGPPCPVCGTPNSPQRKFCRHCATPLHPTPAAPPPSGWRTWWPFRRQRRIGGRWGRIARRAFALLVVLALIVAAVAFLPAGRSLYQTVLDKLGHAVAVVPATVTANASAPGHPASAASDGVTNRYWGAPAVGDFADFTFASPIRLLDVIITPGASTDPGTFSAQGRPTSVELIATGTDGHTTTRTVALADRAGAQTVDVGVSDVTRIRIVLRAAAGLGRGRVIAVGEVEFFRRG